jgi:hypothetical protein
MTARLPPLVTSLLLLREMTGSSPSQIFNISHYVARFRFRKSQLGYLSPSETMIGFSCRVSVWMEPLAKAFVPPGTAGNRRIDRLLQFKIALPD